MFLESWVAMSLRRIVDSNNTTEVISSSHKYRKPLSTSREKKRAMKVRPEPIILKDLPPSPTPPLTRAEHTSVFTWSIALVPTRTPSFFMGRGESKEEFSGLVEKSLQSPVTHQIPAQREGMCQGPKAK